MVPGCGPGATYEFVEALGINFDLLPRLAEVVILDSVGISNYHIYGTWNDEMFRLFFLY